MKPKMFVLVLIALAGCQPAEHDLAIAAARVFDGERMLPATTVFVRDGLIVHVGSGRVSPEADLVKCDDCTLLPGLIDSHVHIKDVSDLRQALVFGVTTEIDLYTFIDPELGKRLQQEQAHGLRTDIADFRMGITPVTSPGGLGTFFDPEIPTLDDVAGAQAFVDNLVDRGANHIKIMFDDGRVFGKSWPNLSQEELAASVQAAHARSKLAVVHVTSLFGARAATVAGGDGLAHIYADELVDEELATKMAERGMFQIATLTTVEGAFREPGSGAGLSEDPRLAPYLSAKQHEHLRKLAPSWGREIGTFDTALDTVNRLFEAGVAVLAGTDVPNEGTAHGVSMHRELELLVEAGLSPLNALAAATRLPADHFDLRDRGQIAPGRRADLLLVGGDPSVDITRTRDILEVYKLGVRVDRKSYRNEIASPVDN
jgi:imidazolonepropionase-like amidohydrolase